ncbi:MAG: HAMP domain-containing histidine kinase [Anaerolineae bacterium]|nr:HAMP domain-containing histidine kinase [Anaerolineae bacterium]
MDVSQVSDRLATAAAKALAAEAAAVLLLDDAANRLTVVSAYGVGARVAAPLLALQDVRASTATTPAQMVSEEAQRLPEGFAAAACVSFGTAEHPLGALQVYGARAGQFARADVERLQALADLGALSIASAQRLAALERVDADKSQFIRVATHELRSPVAVSQSLVRTVLKGYAGPVTDQQRDIIARISGRLDFLESLVNDLLDLAASKSPGLADDMGPVGVNASVGRTVLLLQPHAEEKDVRLVHRACCEELVVWGTDDGLDRIFVNLVGNAIKYTPSGGEVMVSLGRAQDDQAVFVRVADTGIGIPEESMKHLFEEFYRAPNAKELEVGTGIGLAIVKDLTERYGGDIVVESVEGKGTTFTVTFPMCFLPECSLV